MKTKHLFYSLALASAFTACTQEELVEAPVVKDNLANRPVAGVVEFSTEGVESRFNYEKEDGFELGDVFGLYLMDEFVDGYAEFEATDHKAEHDNANTTPWRYQNHWFDMYNFTNSIQSNYPFTYKSEGGEKVWKNDAKLVEGNYFAMYPHNEVALNRRELWHAIEPSVKLKKHSTKDGVYQNVENQFWLGYEQIYRDATASAEGVMKMDLTMTGAMVALRFNITNNSHNTVKLDKITFRNKDGKTLPMLAFVRPDRGVAKMKWNTEVTNSSSAGYGWVKMDVANGEYEKCEYKAHYLYNATKTWTRQTIQEIVEWSDLSDGKIPYGLTGAAAEKAYEYSFSYPEGAELLGGVDGGSLLKTYVVVPAMEKAEDWNDLQVCIYGWYKDNNSASGYTYGVLTSKPDSQQGTGLNEDRNYSFNLVKYVNAWEEQASQTKYYRDVNVNFAEYAWKPFDGVQVANTKDMERMVESYLAQLDDAEPAVLTITPDATGIEITSKFVDMLKADAKDNGRTITLNFNGAKNGKITFNDDNTMDVSSKMTEGIDGDPVKFEYSGNLTLINNAKNQVVTKLTIPVVVENYGSLNVYGSGKFSATVKNYKDMIVGNNGSHGGTVATIDNLGSLTLKDGADVTTLNNNVDGVVGKVIVDAFHASWCGSNKATVGTFNNNYSDDCGTCYPSELTVNTGTLKVTNLINDSKLTNNATIEVVTRLTNKQHGGDWYPHGDKVYALTNNGIINGVGEVVNEGIIDNYGELISATVANSSKINGYEGKVKNLVNSEDGVVYIKSDEICVESKSGSEGKFIFEGVTNQEIGTNGADDRIFQTIADIKGSEIDAIMNVTKITHLWLSHNLTVDYNEAGDKSLWTLTNRDAIESIKINNKKNVTIKGELQNKMLTLKNAELSVEAGAKLNIRNALNMTVKSYDGNIDLGTGSSLKNENGEELNDVNHNPGEVVNVTIEANATSTENGAAMKSAMAVAEEGDIVTLPAGEFYFDYQFNLGDTNNKHSQAVSIVGENGTVIKGDKPKVLYFTLSDYSKDLTLKNLTIEDEYTGTAGNPNTIWIRPDNCSENTVVNIVLENVDCKSVMLEAAYVDGITYNVELRGCNIEKVNAHAFDTDAFKTKINIKYDAACNVNIVPAHAIENVTITEI